MKFFKFTLFSIVGTLLIVNNFVEAAHILEPLRTEISQTPPRGRTFGQIEYVYSDDDPEVGKDVTEHELAVEFEIGVGERTQLNLEAEILLEEEEEGSPETENGIKGIAVGLKHRFQDETGVLPDAAFLTEFAPAAGLKGNEAELKATLLLTKNFTNRFLIHLESGILYITERELEVADGETEIHNANIFIYNIAPIVRIIPDRILAVVELNGVSDFKANSNDVSIMPELILVVKNHAFKLGVPIGISEDAKDFGIRFAISKLFR